LKVTLYQDWEHVHALSKSWNGALAASASDTIFLTWEWTEAWWKNYGAGRPLFVLAALDGDELQGIAPFYVDGSGPFGKSVPCLRLIGDGSSDSDYLDIWARRGRETEVVSAFVETLVGNRHAWEWLELHGPLTDSPGLQAMLACARERSWRFSSADVPCATLSLPSNWNDYLGSLKPRFRTKVRSALSFLEEKLGETPRECRVAEELEDWLQVLFTLHTARWQSEGQPGVFGHSSKRAFYLDFSRAALKQGWLAFHRLDWGERPLSTQYGFRYRNKFHLLQEGYDPAFDGLRPGLALRGWLMRHWIETGLEEYDFLAGTASYKMDWGAQRKTSVRLRIARSWLGAVVSIDGPLGRERVKEAIKPIIPEIVRKSRKALLSRHTRHPKRDPQALPQSSARRLADRLADYVYPRTPVGGIGRAIAGAFELAPAANGKGVRRLCARRTPVLQILIFHKVNDDFDPYLTATPVAAFRKQMEYLARNFRVISLDDFIRNGLPANGPGYYLAITFDDGYRDNYLWAFPILSKLGLPATVFLATGYIESGELPWYDQVCLAFKLTSRSSIELDALGERELNLAGDRNRLQVLAQTLAALRRMPESRRQAVLQELFRVLRVPRALTVPNPMLGWDEIRKMKKQGIAFGAHTITHPVLAKLDYPRLGEEVLGSKRTIEDRLQSSIQHFAYPFGRARDIGDEARQVVREAGFKTAVTTEWGVNRVGDDPFDLKRFTPWGSNLGTFAISLDWFRLAGVSRRPSLAQKTTINGEAA
jgi:peptidoglycan/xylan/chitin deacetylase (PgdA/CDA1 family)/CelD/BcsL family acetyltransferase involved in cellulose biosynthesis